LLAELQAAGRLTKVYALDQDRIIVFKSESP
jgi:predicted ribosome quality control (RQC) complex YloA/Tae2 family protein